MATMRAVVANGVGGPDVLSLSDSVPRAVLASQDHIILKVAATAVNRADTAQRKGLYPPPPGVTNVLGLEACGVIDSLGSNVSAVAPWLNVGDRVMALLPGGGYAEYVTVHALHVMPLPVHLSFAEGAAIAEVFLTAWQCLVFNMDVKKGSKVLIHAGASGVGTAAAQLAQKVLGATAIATCSEGKVAECLKYAAFAVSRTPETTAVKQPDGSVKDVVTSFESKVRQAVGDGAINAVIDPVFGGGYLSESINLCGNDAEITVLAMMGGAVLDGFNATAAFRRRVSIKFSTLRTRDDAYKAELVASFARRALPYFAETVPIASRVVPVVDSVIPIADVAKAHTLIDASESVGKIVLSFE